jgi:hypothetical protein
MPAETSAGFTRGRTDRKTQHPSKYPQYLLGTYIENVPGITDASKHPASRIRKY